MLRPGGRFVFFLNHPLLQTPGSGWIDDQILDEQYWRIGPYLVEDKTARGGGQGRVDPVHPPAALPLRQRHGRGRDAHHPDGGARPAARASSPGPQEYAEAATIPRLLFLRAEKLGLERPEATPPAAAACSAPISAGHPARLVGPRPARCRRACASPGPAAGCGGLVALLVLGREVPGVAVDLDGQSGCRRRRRSSRYSPSGPVTSFDRRLGRP